MSMMQGWTVIGIFEEQDQARQAIDELHEAGFSDDQVGFVFRDGVPTVNKVDVEAEENASAFTGGIMGGILGAADALLTPILGPSVANTIPSAAEPVAEQALERFQHGGNDGQEFKSGRTIVTVKTDDQQQKALDILYSHGARYANAHDRE